MWTLDLSTWVSEMMLLCDSLFPKAVIEFSCIFTGSLEWLEYCTMHLWKCINQGFLEYKQQKIIENTSILCSSRLESQKLIKGLKEAIHCEIEHSLLKPGEHPAYSYSSYFLYFKQKQEEIRNFVVSCLKAAKAVYVGSECVFGIRTRSLFDWGRRKGS